MRMETSIAASGASGEASASFAALADAIRGELKRHCYRMMGGVQDAEDCVQEALLRGWREFSGLRDRTAARTWLYSIATRVCLDALRTRRRRQTLFGPSLDEIEPGDEPWVEPWPGVVRHPVPNAGRTSGWPSSRFCTGSRLAPAPYFCCITASA
jgi:RNA polymerase sigma-70 factor (ECF subfamily)